jgi:hypothetical protein
VDTRNAHITFPALRDGVENGLLGQLRVEGAEPHAKHIVAGDVHAAKIAAGTT